MQKNKAPELKLIDLDSVIRNQKSKFISKLPQFVINLIKRIIKQDGLNQFIIDNNDKEGIDFVNACMNDLNVNINVINEENIPDKGKFIFVSNHPLGGVDVGVVIATITKKHKNLKAVANEILSNVDKFKDIIIEVGVFSKTDIQSIKKMNDIYASDEVQIFILPAGLVSRKTKRVVRDLPWKHSFIKNAVKYRRDIIPIFVDDTNSKKFYFIANLRKFLKIKMSLETIFIPAELFKKRNKTINLIIGKPISYKLFDRSKSPKKWALTIQNLVYNLKKDDN